MKYEVWSMKYEKSVVSGYRGGFNQFICCPTVMSNKLARTLVSRNNYEATNYPLNFILHPSSFILSIVEVQQIQ